MNPSVDSSKRSDPPGRHSLDPLQPLSPLNHMAPLQEAEKLYKTLFRHFGKYAWLPLLLLLILVGIRQYRAYQESIAPMPTDPDLQIQFIDVGQADAALLICEGQTMLIDGGNVGDGEKLFSLLKKRNIQTLDYLVCTHAHEDHVGGLAAALTACEARTILCPVTDYDSSAFRNFAERAAEITVPHPGDRFDLGGAKVQILACDPEAEETNNTSIVLKVTYGQTAFLFTGDAEYPVEQTLLDRGYDPSATVLKVGHHGSASSTSYRFLNAVMPQYAVISVGAGNSYGHPDDTVLSRLRDADVTVYRTDLDGDLYCTSDGKKVTFTEP